MHSVIVKNFLATLLLLSTLVAKPEVERNASLSLPKGAEQNASSKQIAPPHERNASEIERLREIEAQRAAARAREAHKQKEAEQRTRQLEQIRRDIAAIDERLKRDLWYTRYSNHQTYLEIKKQLAATDKKLSSPKIQLDKHQMQELTKTDRALQNQLDLLQDFKAPPFEELTKPKDIQEPPTINSPFDIFNGFTYLKLLKNRKEKYNGDLASFKSMIDTLKRKAYLLQQLVALAPTPEYKGELAELRRELEEIGSSYDIASVTNRIYNKKLEDIALKVTDDIKVQMKRLFNIAIVILVIILLSFLMKYIAKKTISDNERYYMANKIINFSNFTLIILVLLFSFLENVTYVVTVLGFASAGIAIAMKDLFMSILGWLVIVFGGSFHVGDRVKAVKNGVEYVGDIVDISLLKMTLLEDITLTTYMHNRRAGRVIFIPNNYIFTELLANYTHGKIKTVWDGVDVTVTFDSNHKKAAHKIKEIVKKYSKGYTDISRKQLNKLRSQYSLKNINVDPRIYTFVEPNGIRISCWYMTNSYATLTLRSNIFANIIDMINEEPDIAIAYPTQVVNLKRDTNIPVKEEGEESLS